MSDGDDGAAVLAVLEDAESQNALTGLGTRLGPQVQALLASAETIGYGNLASRGKQEQQQIAVRMETRLPTLFATVSRLFGAGFVSAMTADDRIGFARSLFELYSADPDLSVEAPGVDLDPFLPAADAEWFAYLDDAEEFYQSGPAFRGRTITYGMASVLLDDLFAQAAAKANGTSDDGAVLRFTHAEEVEPLAVLLGLPGSTKAADPDRPYTYADNPWRGATVAPMAANIQWDLYAGHGRFLVRMLYNEKETAFKPSCRPIARGSLYYDLTELRRCYGA